MTDPLTFLPVLGVLAVAVGVRRVLTRKKVEVSLTDFEVEHPLDAFDMEGRDEARWRRSYSGY